MSLINRGENKLQATLFPWMDGTGHKVRAKTPFVSPWRTIKVNEDLDGLVNNYIELNLNGDPQYISVVTREAGRRQ